MGTVICIAGIVIGSTALERRFTEQGNSQAARSVKHFCRWFMVGAGGYVVYICVLAASALLFP